MDIGSEKKSWKFNILLGILIGGGFLYVVVLSFELISLTFYKDKDTLVYLADEKYSIMSINGDIVLGETTADAEINIFLRDVDGYHKGDDRSYVNSNTEFAVINEGDATLVIKNIIGANVDELKALEKVIEID